MSENEPIEIVLLGKNDEECEALQKVTDAGLEGFTRPYTLEVVTDPTQQMLHGVTLTPAFVVEGAVRAMGRIPEVDEVKNWLAQA